MWCASPNRAQPGLDAKPLDVAIGRLFAAYCPGASAMVVDGDDTQNKTFSFTVHHAYTKLVNKRHKRNPLVGTLENGYVRNVPLPRIPRIQSTNQVASVLMCREPAISCYSRIAWIPTYSERLCLPEGFGTIPIIPFSPLVG